MAKMLLDLRETFFENQLISKKYRVDIKFLDSNKAIVFYSSDVY
jgi:hypothetical protein